MRQRVTNQIIVQARMGSTRLPGKVLMDLAGYPVIDHVVVRASAATKVDRLVVATTDLPDDDQLYDWCGQNHICCVRGDSDDVLGRFITAIDEYPCDNLIRITADCPFVDPGVIDSLITLHQATMSDYTSNVLEYSFPHGLDAEVVSTEVLRRMSDFTRLDSHREHVTLYIRENPDRFATANLGWGRDDSGFRLTLDHQEDYRVISKLFELLKPVGRLFSLYQVIELANRMPELFLANAGIDRYEGLCKSLDAENRGLKL